MTKLEQKQKELIKHLDAELEYNFGQRRGYISIREEIFALEKQVEQEPVKETVLQSNYDKAVAEIGRLQRLLKLIEDSED